MVNQANRDVSPYSIDYENPLANEGKLHPIYEGDEHNKQLPKQQRNYTTTEVEDIRQISEAVNEESKGEDNHND